MLLQQARCTYWERVSNKAQHEQTHDQGYTDQLYSLFDFKSNPMMGTVAFRLLNKK